MNNLQVFVNNKPIDKFYKGIFLQKKYIEIEVNEKINENRNIKINLFGYNYNESRVINWNSDGLSYYNNILENNRSMFINCDMYDEFLPWKILIEKKNDDLYIKTVKHYLKK